MTEILIPPVAPSAPAPAVPQPAAPAAPIVAASPAATPMTTLADYDRYASQALQAEPPAQTPEPPAAPAPALSQESPPAAAEATTGTEGTQATDTDDEPSAEVLASLNDAGKRALQAEREKRKSARAEVATLREQLAALEARINSQQAPATPPTATAGSEEVASQTATAQTARTPSVPASLVECRTFDQVDACTMQATQQKALATELIFALQRGETDSVRETLKSKGIERIGDAPVDTASELLIGRLLIQAQAGCELTLQGVENRKNEIRAEAMSLHRAGEILPDFVNKQTGQLNTQSASFKAFQAAIAQNPNVRLLGPDWPERVAEAVAYRLGRAAKAVAAGTNGTEGTKTTSVPSAPPAPRAAPGAPRTSTVSLPQVSERDQIAARFKDGTATKADMDRYASLSVLQNI